MTTAPQKPLPIPSPETEPFWQACKNHELMIPYCNNCQSYYWYPRFFCPLCFSRDVGWRKASGRGRLYTYAIQHRPAGPGFANDVPYITAIVQLDEGPRLFTNLVEVAPDPKQIQCDMPVEVVFDDVTEEITIPKFRPVRS